MTSPELNDALSRLFNELVHGSPADACYVLNPKDPGLLASLDRLSAASASAPGPGGGSSVVAHVDHLHYGFEVMNRWFRGENPFADADYSGSWRRGTVDEQAWAGLRSRLRSSIDQWSGALEKRREVNPTELMGMIGSVVHLAYHLGAMRQINRTLIGPTAND